MHEEGLCGRESGPADTQQPCASHASEQSWKQTLQPWLGRRGWHHTSQRWAIYQTLAKPQNCVQENSCCLMPLHLGVVCYAATGNRNRIWYQEWGSAETQTWSMYWLRALMAGRSWKNLDKIISNGWKRGEESLVAEEGNRSHILAST